MTALEALGVRKTYGGVVALDEEPREAEVPGESGRLLQGCREVGERDSPEGVENLARGLHRFTPQNRVDFASRNLRSMSKKASGFSR